MMNTYIDMNLQQTIRRILREETEIPLFIKRRFTPEDLEWLINDIKELIEFGESLDTAIYDGVREFIKGKKFSDIDEFGDEQSYWDSYLKYEKPLVKYVKDKINNTRITEEIGDKKHDKSRLIEKLLYTTFVIPNKDIVCGVEVKHPDDREVLQGQSKYISYSITITFIGEIGTNTLELMDEVWGIVYDYTNTPCDIYSKYVKEC
jgi:hypothetical protein